MITVWIGVLILAIGATGFRKRKEWLADFRDRGPEGQETMGPSLNVLVAYGFPLIGLMMIAIGLLSEL